MKKLDLNQITTWFKSLQDDICKGLEKIDGPGRFSEDLWDRPEGGGGRSRVIQGEVIEKGGVMFSHVFGTMPEAIAKGLEMDPGHFDATGVSIVLHAKNPWVPIVHMNVRYFESESGKWWFGGGIDATPHYINIDEAKCFHAKLKEACDLLSPTAYDSYKSWADDYFYNVHRKETRGVGGIFFDKLNDASGFSKAECWAFVQEVGRIFVDCYAGFAEPNKNRKYSENELAWQKIRRSRYVEFNLVYDRGTKFGLKTGGRIESILMSMPPEASWVYNHQTIPGSPEDETQQLLRKDIDWLKGKAG